MFWSFFVPYILLPISHSCFQDDITERIMIRSVEILKKQISKKPHTLPPFEVFAQNPSKTGLCAHISKLAHK